MSFATRGAILAAVVRLHWHAIWIEVETYRALRGGPLPCSHSRIMSHLRAIAAIEGKQPSPNW